MSNPFFSVIIPAYNPGAFLGKTLQSVLDQTFDDWELIIIDDGSREDESETIAQAVAEARRQAPQAQIHFFRHENQGVSATRNIATAKAQAPWLAFLDNDDLWLPTMLEEQHRVLTAHPELALCHSNYEFLNDTDDKITPGFGRAVSYLKFLEGNFPIFPCCCVVSKAVTQSVGGYDPLYPLAQDLDFYLKIFSRYPVKHLPISLALYRIHASNASTHYRGVHREIAHILNKHLIHALSHSKPELVRAARRGLQRIRNIYSEQAFNSSRRSLGKRQWRDSASHFAYSFRLKPATAISRTRDFLQGKISPSKDKKTP